MNLLSVDPDIILKVVRKFCTKLVHAYFYCHESKLFSIRSRHLPFTVVGQQAVRTLRQFDGDASHAGTIASFQQ